MGIDEALELFVIRELSNGNTWLFCTACNTKVGLVESGQSLAWLYSMTGDHTCEPRNGD
jgi:hypothetical protein